jgi:hypothetical protein
MKVVYSGPIHTESHVILNSHNSQPYYITTIHLSYKSKCLLIMCDLPKCLSLSSSAAVAAASACTSAFAASLATAAGRAEVPNGASVPNSCFFCTSQCKRCFTVYLPRTCQQQISALLLLFEFTRCAMSRWSACCSSAAARSSTRFSGGLVSLLQAISKFAAAHEHTTQ